MFYITSKFHDNGTNTFGRLLEGAFEAPPPQAQEFQKSPGGIGLRWYDTKKPFFPNLILSQVVVICEHVDPSHAQKYTNWLCCCHGNVLVYTFVGF